MWSPLTFEPIAFLIFFLLWLETSATALCGPYLYLSWFRDAFQYWYFFVINLANVLNTMPRLTRRSPSSSRSRSRSQHWLGSSAHARAAHARSTHARSAHAAHVQPSYAFHAKPGLQQPIAHTDLERQHVHCRLHRPPRGPRKQRRADEPSAECGVVNVQRSDAAAAAPKCAEKCPTSAATSAELYQTRRVTCVKNWQSCVCSGFSFDCTVKSGILKNLVPTKT